MLLEIDPLNLLELFGVLAAGAELIIAVVFVLYHGLYITVFISNTLFHTACLEFPSKLRSFAGIQDRRKSHTAHGHIQKILIGTECIYIFKILSSRYTEFHREHIARERRFKEQVLSP